MVKLKTLNVVFVHPDLGIGGAERLVLDVAVALADQGVNVKFVTNHFDRTHAFEELKSGKYPVEVIGDWLPRTIFGMFNALCAYLRMLYLSLVYCFFTRFFDKPDIYFVDQIPMAVPILKWTKTPIIYYCHHPDLLSSPKGGLLKNLYRKPIDFIELQGTKKCDIILVNSNYTASIFHKTFPSIKHEIKTLYPTIASSFQRDLKKIEKVPVHMLVPEITEVKATDVVFLSINRFHPAKELELAINAMEELRQMLNNSDFSRVHLIIAGGFDPQSQVNATYFRKLVKLTHQKDLVVKVTFLKSPSDKLKAQLLKSCDCLIYTPTNEHFGIVPLEAMTAAKPVIACNSGGPRETIEHDVTGFLCEPNPVSLATFMSRFLDKDLGVRLGTNGLKRLERLFSYENFCKNCMDIVLQKLPEIK